MLSTTAPPAVAKHLLGILCTKFIVGKKEILEIQRFMDEICNENDVEATAFFSNRSGKKFEEKNGKFYSLHKKVSTVCVFQDGG